MGNVDPSGKSPERLRRVKRLKRMIIGTIIFLIIVPTVICVLLGIRVSALKTELNRAREELNFYMEQLSEATFIENSNNEDDDFSFEGNIVPSKENDSLDTDNWEKTGNADLSEGEVADLELTIEELFDGYRKVYLTFDDGPSSNTDKILDVLKAYDVKATFFVVQREGRNNERLYRRIVDEGHSIGMHSTDHVYRNLYSGLEAFKSDTKEIRDFLYMVTGVESNIYRFPGGSSNRVSSIDMHVFADELQKEGIVFYDWNISSQDASAVLATKEQIVANVTQNICKHDESMILFHDLGSKDTTVEALPEIIEYIQSLDNTVILPISDDTKPIQHLSQK